MDTKHVSDLYDEGIHAAIEALYRSLGAPEEALVQDAALNVPVSNVPSSGLREVTVEPSSGYHPVFGLASHFRGHDDSQSKAFTGATARGDVMVIPGYGEDGRIYALEIAFHKGITTIRNLRFPEDNTTVHATLLELLERFETR